TLDDGSPGFTAVGWTSTSSALAFGSRFSISPTSPSTAEWAFTGLTPGLYRVFTTWTSGPDRSTSAPYSIFDDTTLRATALINQEKAPVGGPRAGGVEFQQLAGTVNIPSGTLKVQLSNRVPVEQDGQAVVADAVRIERLAGTVSPGFLVDGRVSFLDIGSAA